MATTKLLIFLCVLVLGIREIWVIVFHIPRSTISEAVWDEFARSPIVMAAFVFLCGHLLWQSPAAYRAISQAETDVRLKAKAGAILGEGETEKDK